MYLMGANSCMLCVVVLLLSAGVLGEDAVIVGTANNLIPETAEGLSLVLFHLPTSDASNAFLLEWNRAAQMIKGKAKMIQIDASTERDLVDLHGPGEFPTVRIFRDGESSDYDSWMDAESLSAWVDACLVPVLPTISTKEELEAYKAAHRTLAVTFVKADNASNPSTAVYRDLVEQGRGFSAFVQTLSPELAEQEGVRQDSLVVYKHYGAPKDVLYPFDVTRAFEFVQNSSFPDIHELSQSTIHLFRRRDLPVVWLFVDLGDEAKTTAAINAVKNVAAEYRGVLSFGWCSARGTEHMAQELGLSGVLFPSLAIEAAHGPFGLVETFGVTEASVGNLVRRWDNGIIGAAIRSDPQPGVPVVNGVHVMVGSTAEEIAFDPAHNVFALFTSPSCTDCEAYTRELEAAAASTDATRFATFSVAGNDVLEDFLVDDVPSLRLVKSVTNEVLVYKGDVTKKAILKWVDDNTGTADPKVAAESHSTEL